MKKHLHIYLGVVLTLFSITSNAQQFTIPDAAFASFLRSNVPACMSGDVLDTQCPAVTSKTSLTIPPGNIADLTGIEYFTSLLTLTCNNNKLTSIPTLPASLQNLYLRTNLITSITNLPSNLVLLDVRSNKISSIDGFPVTLEDINLNSNLLTSLPSLPVSLLTIDAGLNSLTSLPGLPEGLLSLQVSHNDLSSLPDLPSTLTDLGVDNNQLTNLPDLPSSLSTLIVNYNSLSTLPALPSSLSTLSATNNLLTDLPQLPESLLFLTVNSNSIDCLPTLPDNMMDLQADVSIGCLPNLPSNPSFTSSIPTSSICGPSNDPHGCLLTGVAKRRLKADMLQVYPNPSKGTFKLSCDPLERGNVSILNANGKVVYAQTDSDFSGALDVDLSSEQKGLYIIQVVSGDNVITKKVVLN